MIENNIVISRYKNCILCMYFEKSIVSELKLFKDEDLHIDNIYLGRVKNIVKNIDAAFIEISPGKQAYFDLKGLKDLHICNRKADGSLHQGDEVIVRISKAAVKSKNPVCTAKLGLSKQEKEDVIKIAETRKAFSVLRSGQPEYLSFLDKTADRADLITTDDISLYEEIDAYLYKHKEAKRSVLKLYNDDYPMDKLYKVESIMDELRNKTVWLKSGANIVLEYTEAMNIIDVNSAKSINLKADNTILNINKEAVNEAYRQIRLRNLSGIILIDLINDPDNIEEISEYIKETIQGDEAGLSLVDITPLFIAEMTRKKKSAPLREVLIDK